MTSEICPSDRFGPWAPDLDRAEYVARCRSMRGLARLLAGDRAGSLCDALKTAEDDKGLLVAALVALDALASLDRRRILASYAALA